MSVLNQASDGQFNVLIVLVRASLRFGPRDWGDLLALCGADVVGVNPSRLNTTLIRWSELGLFAATAGQIAIPEPYRGQLGKDLTRAEGRLPAIAREVLFRADNNRRFWDSEENKSADLSRGLAWLLAQDVYKIDTSSHAKIEELESSQIADSNKRMMQNDTRWNGLKAWAAYLGFGRGESFIVDPTIALRDALPQILPNNAPVSARDFLRQMSERLPVLDTGTYRLQVEEALKASAWSPLEEPRISTSLSRAVERLVQVGELAFEQRADAEDGLQLTGVNGRVWRSFTHIWRPKAAKGDR